MRRLRRRTHHARMHHTRQAQVLHVGAAAADLGRNVGTAQRLAGDRVRGTRAQRRLAVGAQVQLAAGQQFAVRNTPPARRLEHAVAQGQGVLGDLEALRRHPGQDEAHLGGGVAQRGAAVLHRVAAGRITFVRGARGVGGDQADAARVHLQFLGRHLQQGGLDALPQFGLAGEDGDGVVCLDADPGVEPGFLFQAAGQPAFLALGAALALRPGRRQRERQGQGAGGSQQAAPARVWQGRVHERPPAGCLLKVFAARRTARRMRMWVPQRHRFGIMWLRICSSVGLGFLSSRACARMIMPAMQ